jgi:hypothetical protein
MVAEGKGSGASIREVYSLLGEMEGRIVEAVGRVEERQIKQDGQISDLSRNLGTVEERLNAHIASPGHKIGTEHLDDLKLAVARLATVVKVATGVIVTVGTAVAVEIVKHGLFK